MRDTERERQRCRQRRRQREKKQAPCGEPNLGLDPRTPGSCPGPKAGAEPLSHPGIPHLPQFLRKKCHEFGIFFKTLQNFKKEIN